MTHWEVYGMLAAINEDVKRDGRLAIAMENEAIDASKTPSSPDSLYGQFFQDFDTMHDELWRKNYEARQICVG